MGMSFFSGVSRGRSCATLTVLFLNVFELTPTRLAGRAGVRVYLRPESDICHVSSKRMLGMRRLLRL